MYIARRDFFLSGEASYVYTDITIAMFDRIFSPVPSRYQLSVAPKKSGRGSCHRSADSEPSPKPASAHGLAAVNAVDFFPLSGSCRLVQVGAAKLLGWGAITREDRVA